MSPERRAQDEGRRRADRHAAAFRKWGRRAAVAYMILLGVASLAIWHLQQQQDLSQLKMCHRLNVVRAAGNRSGLAVWEALGTAAQRDPLDAAEYEQERGRLMWVPVTRSCQAAIDSPDAFRAPEPVAFGTRRPGPSDLKVGRGQ